MVTSTLFTCKSMTLFWGKKISHSMWYVVVYSLFVLNTFFMFVCTSVCMNVDMCSICGSDVH